MPAGLIGFFRAAYADNRRRRSGRRRLARDLLLYGRNLVWRREEARHLEAARETSPRVAFIVGAPRSGTTLLYQLLASTGELTYVPNAAAGHFMAPAVGISGWRDRFAGESRELALRSEFGGTPGPHGPHEFSYFWHWWMGPASSDDRTEEEWGRVDWEGIRSELAALTHVGGRPVVLKSINFVDYAIDRFAALLGEAVFLHIRREPGFVVQSILESRRKRYGSSSEWWSVRPRGHAAWAGLDPIEQIVRQVSDIESAVSAALSNLPAERRLQLSYEELVTNPGGILRQVAARVGVDPEAVGSTGDRLELRSGNERRMSDDEWTGLLERLGDGR